MSEEQLKAFWEAIQADAGLQQKLQGVTEPDAVAAIAKEAGFIISSEEIKKAQSGQLFAVELADEQLENVAGGGGVTTGVGECVLCVPPL
jgi:predicted ribosomally synthesized peptide with nif11-like leader